MKVYSTFGHLSMALVIVGCFMPTRCIGNDLAIVNGPQNQSEAETKEKPDQKSTKEKSKASKKKQPAVDIAILLDTSNSMDGLISQAQNQLWNIVRKISEAEKKNQKPSLRVAVFEYGNSNLPASENYIRQVVQLTDDLDKVSEGLFQLKTDGGDEYCGAVIQEAIRRLDWSSRQNGYKAIYIAGNEPFTQGDIDYEATCREAIEKGIVVNTIHCGDYDRGVEGQWKRGAEIAEGKFMNINQDRKIVQIKTPHDGLLIQLNAELNSTYLWYGSSAERDAFQSNQIMQDKNSITAGSSLSRIATKAGSAYSNRGRDLIDSYKSDADFLKGVDPKLLPEAMQKMSRKEREEYVESMAKKRQSIQVKIAEATKQRDEFIAAQLKSQAGDTSDTFGDVINEAVASQLQEFGFEVE